MLFDYKDAKLIQYSSSEKSVFVNNINPTLLVVRPLKDRETEASKKIKVRKKKAKEVIEAGPFICASYTNMAGVHVHS